MRILLVTQYFWPERFRVNDLVRAWVAHGHEVTVLTGLPNYPGGSCFPGYGWRGPWREAYSGSDVRRVPLLSRGRGRGLRLALNYLSFALSATLLGPLVCRGPSDLVFVYEPSPITVALPALWLRRLRRVPVALWVQDLWPESLSATGAVRSPLVLRWTASLVRFIYRRCDLILVQAEGFVDNVRALGPEAARLQVLHNWAEDFYQPLELPPEAPERAELPSGFVIVFAGNIGAAQSFETILEAADRLRDNAEIQWVIIGDGRRRSWLEDEIRRLGLGGSVRVLGPRPAETMPRYFSLADLLLVTLRRDPALALTMPTKLQSYLACGKPIVGALDGEGARVIVEARAGSVVPAEHGEALAGAVLDLYRADAAERARMGRRGREYFEAHFEREGSLRRLEESMRTLVETAACAS